MKNKVKEFAEIFVQALLLGAGIGTGLLIVSAIEKLF
jgi:hypothetical protein